MCPVNQSPSQCGMRLRSELVRQVVEIELKVHGLPRKGLAKVHS